MKKEVEYVIDKNINTIQTVSFRVPSFCKRLYIKHNVPQELSLMFTVVVTDVKNNVRLQKQLGYSESVLSIGENYDTTTIGGVPGKIDSGIWKFKIYFSADYIRDYIKDNVVKVKFEISDDQVAISENVGSRIWVDESFKYSNYNNDELYKSGSRWYKGDFHAHTRLSDGKESPDEVTKKAKYMNLDFYTATEHNLLHTGWAATDVLILPGVEITTGVGHANIFSVVQRPDFLDDVLEYGCNPKEAIKIWKKITRWCKDNKALLSINHPFLYKWKWLNDDISLGDVSALEIINDPTYESVKEACAKEANELSVKLADLLWDDGYRICAIGGSDSHNKLNEFYDGACEASIAGDPATWLYMNNLTANNIYQALSRCRACITRYIDQLDIELYAGKNEIYPGDIVEDAASFSWKIIIKISKHIPKLFYVQNNVKYPLILRQIEAHIYEGEGRIVFTDTDYNWIRFGAVGEHGEFLMYTNPITKGKKKHLLSTFGEAKNKLKNMQTPNF